MQISNKVSTPITAPNNSNARRAGPMSGGTCLGGKHGRLVYRHVTRRCEISIRVGPTRLAQMGIDRFFRDFTFHGTICAQCNTQQEWPADILPERLTNTSCRTVLIAIKFDIPDNAFRRHNSDHDVIICLEGFDCSRRPAKRKFQNREESIFSHTN